MIHIHFVCTGNTYRSRLAEMYLRSKELPNIKVSSSGIEASKNLSGPISWYTARLAKHHKSTKHLSHSWTQTTNELLSKADLVVFMAPIHHEQAEQEFAFHGVHKTLNIPDLLDLGIHPTTNTLDEDLRRMKLSEDTFGKIQREVDVIIKSLATTA